MILQAVRSAAKGRLYRASQNVSHKQTKLELAKANERIEELTLAAK